MCQSCLVKKQHHQVFLQGGRTCATKVLEIIHSNICVSMEIQTLGQVKYFATFIDEKSHFTNIYI
jgi:hypothetical protein